MIWVLLQLESPWRRNDAITFFISMFFFSVPGVLLRHGLRKYVPAIVASIMAKFEQIFMRAFWKYFESEEVLKSQKCEIACYPHN